MALLLAALPALAQHGHQPMHQRFEDAERWSKVFDDPERDAWQKPDEVIRALNLAPDAVVADIGSGTGYFAVRLARALLAGRVFGADLEPDMVRFLNERAARERLPKPRGRVAIIDFRPESPVGPPPRHRIAASAVIEEMKGAGYALEASVDVLPYQYFLLFSARTGS